LNTSVLFSAALYALTFFSSAFADDALLARQDVQIYIQKIAKNTGLSSTDITAALRNAQFKPNIITALNRPSTKLPWHRFSANMVSQHRVTQGVQFWHTHQDVLAQVSKQYGVEPEVIVAILGIETHYGRDTGSFHAIDALSTIAFHYPRRAEYFQKELCHFFVLANQIGGNLRSLKSSYAGAMGMAQFMPSSVLKYAVNITGSRNQNIWENENDAIASVANYLQQFGWQKGAKIVSQTRLADTVSKDQLSDYMHDAFDLNHTIADWKKRGIYPTEPIADSEKALLFKLDQINEIEYWLGLNNFYVITRYNKSTMYAMAVTALSQSIKTAYQNSLDKA
jgi:membrane-bound lytic murein transglycosylase B